MGIKNVFELEGAINSRDCCFKFWNRSLSIFPKECVILKPKDDEKLIKVNAPFIDEISGLAIVKILDGVIWSTGMLKLKFMWNSATLDISNNGLDTIIFKSEEMSGILDPRSLGYYKIKQDTLQQYLSKYYRFKKADTLCEHFNKFINMPKKEKEQEKANENYQLLDPSDERKYMADKEIPENI